MEQDIEKARLTQDYCWWCTSGNTTEAEVRACYVEKHHVQPERVFQYRGLWWAGPTSSAPKLTRYLYPGISEVTP
jgi:hypothetical protein